ncbi:MAG: DUF5696 domain-containing protein [Ruminococcus sp.]|nr:DUF5696 domain-containing protein [Ruminococcus sp.]
MHKDKIKKLIACALVVTMILPAGIMNTFAEDEEETTEATEATTEVVDEEELLEDLEEDLDELPAKVTDEEALAACKLATTAGDLSLYYDEENARVCLLDESNGQTNYWWSTPINAEADDTVMNSTKVMKSAQRQQLNSGLVVTYGNRESRTISTVCSGTTSGRSKVADTTITTNSDGITITYDFTKQGFVIPVDYTLTEEGLTVSCDTSKIEEEGPDSDEGLVITEIQLTPFFASQPETDAEGNAVEGYMIIPDGTGAVINYNNGKGNYSTVYSQKVYGRNYTNVPLQQPRTTEQAYFPVAAHVMNNKALVAIVTEGDSDVTVNARINGQGNQTYNSLYYEFEVRGSDDYELSGENSALKVFEKGDIQLGTIAVTYYPLTTEDEDEEINYADVAKVYRDYLVETTSMTSNVTDESSTSLYVDFYGAVIKSTSILGIPFDLQTEITTFDQAQEILQLLKDAGTDDIVVNYNDWTDKSIDGKISTKAKASSTVGGTDGLEDLITYGEENDITIYPALDNMEMENSSLGYFTFTSTAIRVSGSYSRQTRYNPAFGEEPGVAPALLTPTAYTKVFTQIIESYSDAELTNVSFGGFSSRLVSDYSSSNYCNRKETLETIVEYYQEAQETLGSVLADEANAYIIPYVDYISNVPVYSSQFNIVDYDIPLYQMIVHGYVPYSTTAINASSNSDETFLLALAYGSSVHYDFIYADTSVLHDTDYDDLYYANYESWIDEAANQSQVVDEVLSDLGEYVITNYDYDTETQIAVTTYGTEDGEDVATVEVDLANKTVKLNGQEIDVSQCLEEGGDEE